MEVVNRKMCDGLETYVLLETVWIRLTDLPAVLRMMPARRRNEVLQDLEQSGLVLTRNRGLVPQSPAAKRWMTLWLDVPAIR